MTGGWDAGGRGGRGGGGEEGGAPVWPLTLPSDAQTAV